MDRATAMRAVHEQFAGSDPELPNGFAEHGPMGAEAMLSLGLDPEAVVRWAERHRPEPVGPERPVQEVYERFAAELATDDWRPVVAREVDLLVGRLDAHLFHGLIRTAHAVRALENVDHPAGRAELATALAAWTVWSEGSVREPDTSRGAHPDDVVADAARRGAAAFLDQPSIVTIHAVTAPMAFLLLADLVEDDARRRAAGVFTRTHGRYPATAARRPPVDRPGLQELAPLATRWDAHAAKLVEAALRGHDLTDDPVFLHAATAMLR